MKLVEAAIAGAAVENQVVHGCRAGQVVREILHRNG